MSYNRKGSIRLLRLLFIYQLKTAKKPNTHKQHKHSMNKSCANLSPHELPEQQQELNKNLHPHAQATIRLERELEYVNTGPRLLKSLEWLQLWQPKDSDNEKQSAVSRAYVHYTLTSVELVPAKLLPI